MPIPTIRFGDCQTCGPRSRHIVQAWHWRYGFTLLSGYAAGEFSGGLNRSADDANPFDSPNDFRRFLSATYDTVYQGDTHAYAIYYVPFDLLYDVAANGQWRFYIYRGAQATVDRLTGRVSYINGVKTYVSDWISGDYGVSFSLNGTSLSVSSDGLSAARTFIVESPIVSGNSFTFTVNASLANEYTHALMLSDLDGILDAVPWSNVFYFDAAHSAFYLTWLKYADGGQFLWNIADNYFNVTHDIFDNPYSGSVEQLDWAQKAMTAYTPDSFYDSVTSVGYELNKVSNHWVPGDPSQDPRNWAPWYYFSGFQGSGFYDYQFQSFSPAYGALVCTKTRAKIWFQRDTYKLTVNNASRINWPNVGDNTVNYYVIPFGYSANGNPYKDDDTGILPASFNQSTQTLTVAENQDPCEEGMMTIDAPAFDGSLQRYNIVERTP